MKSKVSPFLWSGIVMVLALCLSFYAASREKLLLEASGIVSPDISLGPVVAYFFGVVVVLALILYFIPLKWLHWAFRVLFALMFAWGVFIVAVLTLPATFAYAAAVIAGLAWLFLARVWLHDLLLLVTLAGAGSAFGFLFSPLTFMIFMLVIAVYDAVAVRFGFMVWMADKMSDATTLPAFVFPRGRGGWGMKLEGVRVGDLKEKPADEREYTILGGGDIGFPLMLTASIFFESGLGKAAIVGAFALAGLMGAFLMQILWFKGKPVPALPPIALFCLAGFLTVWLALG